MNRRLFAGVLWFLCGWYAGAAIAWMLALDPVLAPILAVATGCLVLGDPRHVIWAQKSRMAPSHSDALAEAA